MGKHMPLDSLNNFVHEEKAPQSVITGNPVRDLISVLMGQLKPERKQQCLNKRMWAAWSCIFYYATSPAGWKYSLNAAQTIFNNAITNRILTQ